MIQQTDVAIWARSMAQLMKNKVVTKSDVEMILDAHGLEYEYSTTFGTTTNNTSN